MEKQLYRIPPIHRWGIVLPNPKPVGDGIERIIQKNVEIHTYRFALNGRQEAVKDQRANALYEQRFIRSQVLMNTKKATLTAFRVKLPDTIFWEEP